MNGNSLARQFAGTGMAKDAAKSAAKKCGEKCSEKNAAKNAAKNAVKNSTAEKQLFGICHDCFHFGPGTLLATRFLDPFPRRSGNVAGLSLSTVQPIVERNAAECAKGFHALHSWCCSD